MRARLLVLSVLVVGAFPIVGASGVACAGQGPTAALVIDTGSATTTYCVSLGSQSVSGIRFVQLAGDQHGLDYSLGFGGRAVCMLEGVGPTSDDCFEDYPDFWAYWRGDGSGGWQWSSSGAASTRVEDGDVEGWSWGSGQDAQNHQRPPELTYADVCGAPSTPPSKKGGGPKQQQPTTGQPEDEKGAVTEGTAENDEGEPVIAPDDPGSKKERPAKKNGAAGEQASDTPALTEDLEEREDLSVSPASSSSDGEGPPAAGIVALAFSVVAVLAAAIAARRRRGRA